MAKKKITAKKPAKDTDKKAVDLKHTREIAELLSVLSSFFPRIGDDTIPVLSREFTLKYLLGFTDEEFDINENMLANETLVIYNAIAAANDHIAKHAENIAVNKSTTKSKKKVN